MDCLFSPFVTSPDGIRDMKYCYPHLGGKDLFFVRIAGPGLGNMLFPWARATVAVAKGECRLIEPTWPQIKIGPFLRRERDGRSYSNLFRKNCRAIKGLKRLSLLLIARRKNEKYIDELEDGEIVLFDGMDGYFSSILEDYDTVLHELCSIASKESLKGLSFDFKNSISVHVRLGDFSSQATQQEISRGKTNVRIPLEWYREMIMGIREVRGQDIKILIFSDGEDKELAPLLELAGSHRVSFGSALGDMLALSKSEILVASGSTFSMWASYLGRMPVFWHPGQRRQRLYSQEFNEPEIATRLDAISATRMLIAARYVSG